MPLALALVAGALASVNPCGFSLLPAFLSFYVGAEEDLLPRAPARATQGLLVGLLVSAGFLAVFAIVGVPIAYGVTQLTSAIPWAGLAIGVVMVAAAVAGLAGRADPASGAALADARAIGSAVGSLQEHTLGGPGPAGNRYRRASL